MTKLKLNTENFISRPMTQEEFSFHHNFLSTRLAQNKEYLLIRQKQSSRGLTLAESNLLNEINFLIESGFDIHSEPINSGVFHPVERENKKNHYEKRYTKLSKAALVTKLAELEVEMEEMSNVIEMEGRRFKYLLNFYDETSANKSKSRNARQQGKKSGKSKIHQTNKEKAFAVLNEIKKIKSDDLKNENAQILTSIEPQDFKLFCIKMKSQCTPCPSNSTLRNYFTSITGHKSTK